VSLATSDWRWRVAEVVKEVGLSEQRLSRLKTAVAEATMNSMEHGNRYRPEAPVVIEVLSSGADLSVRINDQGRSLVPDTEVPDLDAKLDELQTPRGWGLFLIRNMVDEMHITSDEVHHTVRLVMHLEGGEDAAKQREANVRREPSVAVIDPRPDRGAGQQLQRTLPEDKEREAQPRLREALGGPAHL
jgi:serine/threonine-protein kinase RsbW